MQADETLYLHPDRAVLPEGSLVIGEHDPPDVVLEVDYTTDIRPGKLQVYERWGFPELWAAAPRGARRRPSGVTIHRLAGGRYRPVAASVALPYFEGASDVLDVGCGGGILTEAMRHHGAEVTGIDMADAALAVARLHLRESGLEIDYRKCTAEQLAIEQPQGYELVTCLEMLEHVPDPASVVAACERLLKPGGLAVFSTINRNPKSWLFAIVGAEYVLRLLPRGTHEYAKLIKPSELASWCRAAGLELEDQIGMGYNPLTRRYFLQQNLDVNYIACYRKAANAEAC